MILTLVFGVWLNLNSINFIEDTFGGYCRIQYSGTAANSVYIEQPCSVVAAEINKKSK